MLKVRIHIEKRTLWYPQEIASVDEKKWASKWPHSVKFVEIPLSHSRGSYQMPTRHRVNTTVREQDWRGIDDETLSTLWGVFCCPGLQPEGWADGWVAPRKAGRLSRVLEAVQPICHISGIDHGHAQLSTTEHRKRETNGGLMLGQRCRQWPNIYSILGQYLVFTGNVRGDYVSTK